MKLVYRYTRACCHCSAEYQTNARSSRYCLDCVPKANAIRWQREKARTTPEQREKRLQYFRDYYRNLTAKKRQEKRDATRRWSEARRRAMGIEPKRAIKTSPRRLEMMKLMAHAREEARATGEPRYKVLERIGAPADVVERWFLREGA